MTVNAAFRAAYAEQRAAEGRGRQSLSLPYLREGPLAKQWAVRARSFDALARFVARARPRRVLDLGAGNGWLSYRLALAGITSVAVDMRDDDVDGLGAATCFLEQPFGRFERIGASFEALPLESGSFDMAIFNASLHYAIDLDAVLAEARRVVRPGGHLVVLDSPFYALERDGEAMVREKKASGAYDATLLEPPFIEYLTSERLPGWRRHRVWYPLWYEVRPIISWVRGKRRPSRFDLWESIVS
jgi:SAM-dependent methyltransferase